MAAVTARTDADADAAQSPRRRRFLSLPAARIRQAPAPVRTAVPAGSPQAARRLIAMSQPIRRTLVASSLRTRGIKGVHDTDALRFHPRCFYRPEGDGPTETWPAMVAAITDLGGKI